MTLSDNRTRAQLQRSMMLDVFRLAIPEIGKDAEIVFVDQPSSVNIKADDGSSPFAQYQVSRTDNPERLYSFEIARHILDDGKEYIFVVGKPSKTQPGNLIFITISEKPSKDRKRKRK